MNIDLNGGKMYITSKSDKAFCVLSGNVLVYIVPVTDGRTGRRFRIYEASEGEIIPSFYYDDDKLGSWRFCFVAVDNAVLTDETCADINEIRMDFAKNAGIRLFSPDDFNEQILDAYDLNIVKEEGYIYATGKEQEETYEQGINIVNSMIRKGAKGAEFLSCDNGIYDVTAYICNVMKMPVVPYEDLKASNPRKYDIRDIARLSHFVVRDVVLDENWYKHDCGPLIAFTGKDKLPIACIPKGRSRYQYFDPKNNELKPLTKDVSDKLEIKAVMPYKPFPVKKLNIMDIIKFGLTASNRMDSVFFILLTLIGTAVGLLLPALNRLLYDEYIPLSNKSGLYIICFVMISVTLGNLCFSIVANLATFRNMNKMEYAVQNAAYDRLFNLPESFFRNYDSAELSHRVSGISTMFEICASVGIQTVFTAVFSVMYLWQMSSYAGMLVAPALIMVFCTMLLIGIMSYLQMRYEAKQMEIDGKVSSTMFQFLNGIKKIRIAGVENRALVEYLKPYSRSKKIDIKKDKIDYVAETVNGAAGIIFSIVIYYIVIKNASSLSVGTFMGFLTAFGSFSSAMLGLVSSFLTINTIIPMYKRAKPILDTLPEYEEDTILPGALSGDIEINNVSFAYDKDSENVLNDISMHIKPNEYIGIAGASGCGKSTLLKLLLGFEKPVKGKIFYDGKDIDTLDKRELRKQFGVVLQNGSLISGSIFENITITAPGTTLKQVQSVVEAVGLSEDISKMPMGLHTVLDENSGTISGGQKQRILIARAIVSNPKIIFFDEATSALDNVTQSVVCKTLEGINATKVVIAHRLSTIINCDRIIVLDEGKIAEQGTYNELMEKQGLFYKLASRQLA